MAGVTPPSIPNLYSWYDFSEPTNVFKDVAMTDAVDADGNTVLAVADKSGGGRHLTEALNGPVWVQRGLNTMGTARFDGVNDRLVHATACPGVGALGQTVFVVSKCITNPGGEPTVLFTGAGAGHKLRISGTAMNWYSDNYNNIGSGDPGADTENAVTAGWRIYHHRTWQPKQGGTNYRAQFGRNGSQYLTQPGYASFSPPESATGLALAYDGVSDPGNYEIAENIWYNRALSTAEVNQVGGYLSSKWALQWAPISLPVVNQGAKTTILRNVTANATRGQVDWVQVPDWARVAFVEFSLTAVAGTGPVANLRLLKPLDGTNFEVGTAMHPEFTFITGPATLRVQLGAVHQPADFTTAATGVSDATVPTALPRVLGVQTWTDRANGDETYTYTTSVRFE